MAMTKGLPDAVLRHGIQTKHEPRENGRLVSSAGTSSSLGPIIPIDPDELARLARIQLREQAREEHRREQQRLAEEQIQQTQR